MPREEIRLWPELTHRFAEVVVKAEPTVVVVIDDVAVAIEDGDVLDKDGDGDVERPVCVSEVVVVNVAEVIVAVPETR